MNITLYLSICFLSMSIGFALGCIYSVRTMRKEIEK